MKKLIYIGLCMLTCGVISATPLKAEAAEIPDKNTNESEELLSAGIGDFFSHVLTEEEYKQVFDIDDAVLYYEFLTMMDTKLWEETPHLQSQPVFDFIGFAETQQEFLALFRSLTE